MNLHQQKYEQKIGYSRGSLWAPFHAVGMVARFEGRVPASLLEAALGKLMILYPPLASRVRLEEDGSAWLTTDGAAGFSMDVRSRNSDEDSIDIFLEQEKIPFDFGHGPLIRFFLLHGDQCTDLIVIVPHVICDGYSMTHVMFDAVRFINDPEREVILPQVPEAVTWQTINHAWSDNLLLRNFIKTVNLVWPKDGTGMQQDDFEKMNQYYWQNRQCGLLAFELTSRESHELVEHCRQNGISVSGALVAAFLLAQADMQPNEQKKKCDVSVAVNIRNRMKQPPGQVVGVYASNIAIRMLVRPGSTFWDLARLAHTRIHTALQDRQRILWPLAVGELDPPITDTLLAALCTDRWSRQIGVFTRFVRIGGLAPDLDISNIGRIDPPETGRSYPLANLIPLPPLVPGGGIALNVLTVNGKMNVILKFRHDQISRSDLSKIYERARNYLLNG